MARLGSSAYMMNAGRHTRHTTERNGKYVSGPKRNRMGRGKGGRLKGRGRLNSR